VIRLTSENGNPVVVAETEGYGIYLDNDSLSELATGSASRRQQFVDTLHAKATLLFSWANAIEVSSSISVRAFLDSIGPAWVPLELSPWEVAQREAAGLVRQAVISTSFMQAYFQDRVHDLLDSNQVLDVSPEAFFQLGAVVEWVHERRDKLRTDIVRIDDALRDRIAALRADYERNPASLDQSLPPIGFNEQAPATFVLVHLQRLLIEEAKEYHFKRHDGLDFCHATLAAAYGSLIALDKHWKRRILALPDSEKLARTYYRAEIDDLVVALEALSSR
jgi:hypothetical protein